MKTRTCDECRNVSVEPGIAGGQWHEPSSKDRRLVFELIRCGVGHRETSRVLGVDPKTLRRHYREELDTAKTLGSASVANSLFQMATRGRNVTAAIFWLKARAGWSEKIKIDSSNTRLEQYDLTQLSDEELAQFESLQLKAQLRDAEDDPDPNALH